jgi:uncharacterized membrane protein YoaK (UPF0700 family)
MCLIIIGTEGGASIFALVWFSYAVGAALGAVAVNSIAKPLFVPAAILPFIMIRSRPVATA